MNKRNVLILSTGILFVALLVYLLFFGKEAKDKKSFGSMSGIKSEQREVVEDEPTSSVGEERRVGNNSDDTIEPPKKIIITEKDKDIVQQRRSMAKFGLVSLYGAISATKAEYSRYSTDLILMGYSIEGFSMGQKVIPIKIGFLAPYNPKDLIKNKAGEIIENPMRLDTDFLMKEDPEYRFEYHEDIEGVDLAKYRKDCSNGCKVHPEGFEIMAVFPYPNQRGFEIWTMDHNKTIYQKKLDFRK